MIRNAKQELQRRVIPPKAKAGRGGFIGYRESDAPRIAAKVVEMGLLHQKQAISNSYDRFVGSAAACKGG